MKPIILMAILTLAALAGCADAPADDADPTDSGQSGGSGREAGDSGGSGAAAPSGSSGMVQETAFAKDGATALGGCAWTLVVGQCQWISGDNFLELDFPGNGTQVMGSMTWTGVPGVGAGLYLLRDEGDGWMWTDAMPSQFSDSGEITFDWDVSKWGGQDLALAANAYQYSGTPAGGGGASVPFEFHLEGVVVSVA